MNLNNDIKKILVTNEQIEARCKELAEEIDKEYADKNYVEKRSSRTYRTIKIILRRNKL